ncbi:DsbC family protein [Chitinimonas sp.]|uniref:DsbC family protein n=1 Tax=Chitinimonas sp. TaxID=1934313 RepID=UPI0035B22072
MNRIAQCLAIALAGLAMTACVDAAGEPDLGAIKTELGKKFNGRTVQSVRPTPLKGLYEVVLAPRQVVYADAKGDYILVGDMVDMKRRASLTEERMRELSRTDFNKLPFDQALKLVKGDGSRKVAVFSDPDCPFCKKLERDTLAKLDNVTIYTFLLPLTQLHPDATRKSNLIWCAQDKQKSWEEWITAGKLPANDGSCPTPVAELAKLGEKLGINGTPTMVFESGEVASGAMEAPDFEAKLVAKKP